jgi:hypothetical protein
MRYLLLTIALAAPIAASAGEYRTVEWFRDHPEATRQTVFWCRNNVGLARQEPNCPNAQAGALLAEERAMAAANRNASWSFPPGYVAMWQKNCHLALRTGQSTNRVINETCREIRAPGY